MLVCSLSRLLGTATGTDQRARTIERCEEHLSAPTSARFDAADLLGECVLSSELHASVNAMQLVHPIRLIEGNEDVSAGQLADGCVGVLDERGRREMCLPRTPC